MTEILGKCLLTDLIFILICCIVSKAMDETGEHAAFNYWVKTIGGIAVFVLFPLMVALIWLV